MKRIILSGFFGVFFIVLSAQETGDGSYRFSLEDCLDYALRNNYNRQSLELNEEAREDLYEQAKKERLPNLNASLGESLTGNHGDSPNWQGNYSVSSSVTLYQGGTIGNTIEQNKLLMEQSVYQTSQYENELTIQILQAFLSVLGNEELLKYQQAVVTASEEQVRQGREQYRVGTILESDYLMLESQYASDRTNIVDTEINRTNSLLSLKSLLSMDPLTDLEIVYPDTSKIREMALLPDTEYVLERALLTLPDLKILEYNIAIAEMGVKLARSGYYPTVTMNGSLGTGHSPDFRRYANQLSDRFNEQIGVSVSIPIFDKGRTRSSVTQNKISLRQAEYDKLQTELNIRQTVIQEYQNVISSYNQFQANEIKQNAYFRTFEVYRAQFGAGVITAVDLLQQQNNYISALNDYIQSKYGFILNRKILDVYMGIRVSM